MKDWHKLKPELFKKQPYYLPGCDTYQRKVAVADFEGVCSGDIYVLEPSSDALMPELLPFICQTDAFFDHAVGTSAGSLSPRTNWKSLADFEFLLPPIQEQARLVEAVRACTELVETLFEASKTAETLFRSTLQDRMASGLKPKEYQLFSGEEETLRTVCLGDVASVDRGKFSHRPRNLPQFFGGPYPFAQTGDVAGALGRRFSASQTLSEEGLQYSRSFPEGSILITIAAVIAATAITTDETWCTDSVVGIVPKDPADVDFIECALRYTRPYLEHEVATQTAQKNINLENLRPLRIPWPKSDRRAEIAADLAIIERKMVDLIDRRASALSIQKLIVANGLAVAT
jgi:type I restriction enzyme S subunit